MEKAKAAGDTSGEGAKAAVPSLRQLGDCQTLREVGRGGRGREPSDRQRKEQLRSSVRPTEVSLRRTVRR
jgi:hypothetical protein